MSEFSPDETRRWDAWRRANALKARRGDRLLLDIGLTVVSATLIGLALALGR